MLNCETRFENKVQLATNLQFLFVRKAEHRIPIQEMGQVWSNNLDLGTNSGRDHPEGPVWKGIYHALEIKRDDLRVSSIFLAFFSPPLSVEGGMECMMYQVKSWAL